MLQRASIRNTDSHIPFTRLKTRRRATQTVLLSELFRDVTRCLGVVKLRRRRFSTRRTQSPGIGEAQSPKPSWQ